MALEITIGRPKLALHQGNTVLLTDLDGGIPWPSEKGLYFFDTRLIGSWQLYINGEPLILLDSASLSHFAGRIFLTNRSFATEQGEVRERTVSVDIGRSISGGVHEDIDVVNHGMHPIRFNLEIAIRGDFADIFEVKAGKIVRRGRITTEWCDADKCLRTTYRNRDFRRGLEVRARRSDSPPIYANGRVTFDIALAPHSGWHTCLLYELSDGEQCFEAPRECISDANRSEAGRRLEHWRSTVVKIESRNEDFKRLLQQAIEDLSALRLPVEEANGLEFLPAAGVPWFVAPFGRDSLIASLLSVLVHPEFATAALDVLGRLQAHERDDFRDAEPGKIMHELRRGELAHFRKIPHTPYYGTADATMLYLIVLHSAWRSTGDLGLLRGHLETAERCLQWIDESGDRDGDGFQEYATRSSQGYENQSWKDAGNAVLNPDGSDVKAPKALCELQGYVYDAWLRMAEIYDALGRSDRAEGLRAKAEELFRCFNEVFWDEASGFYAFALGGDKKKVLTVASNPGHCLWSGIVPPDRAEQVVRRLMAPDMWSGWGIRTLSADHPAFNPNSYQNGSIWPHDNAIIALGFRRYGYAAEAARIAEGIAAAGRCFAGHQMPELYAGLDRDPTNLPVQYLGANVPQAWAASSVFGLLQAILGIQPDAPEGRLCVDPVLPDWLPEITLEDLRVGSFSFALRFWREEGTTYWHVTKGDADRVVFRGFGRQRGGPAECERTRESLHAHT